MGPIKGIDQLPEVIFAKTTSFALSIIYIVSMFTMLSVLGNFGGRGGKGGNMGNRNQQPFQKNKLKQ